MFFFEPESSTTIKLHGRRTLVQFFLYPALCSRKAEKFLRKKSSDTAPFNAFAPLRLCVKISVLLCVFILWCGNQLFAQPNTDNQYSKPLKEVLNDVQKK